MNTTFKLLFFSLLFLLIACSRERQTPPPQEMEAVSQVQAAPQSTVVEPAPNTPKVTFVELGSVNCIPCRKMQPVMASIERKYGDQVNVIFYDVWKADQKQYAETYGIRLIPTQVFLDENHAEIMRHEGFFAEAKIDSFLQSRGLEILEGL